MAPRPHPAGHVPKQWGARVPRAPAAHAPPRPINAYAIFLKTSYAWTRKRLGAAAPELAVLDEIAKEWDALDEAGRDPYEALAAKDAARAQLAAAKDAALAENEAEIAKLRAALAAREATTPRDAEPFGEGSLCY